MKIKLRIIFFISFVAQVLFASIEDVDHGYLRLAVLANGHASAANTQSGAFFKSSHYRLSRSFLEEKLGTKGIISTFGVPCFVPYVCNKQLVVAFPGTTQMKDFFDTLHLTRKTLDSGKIHSGLWSYYWTYLSTSLDDLIFYNFFSHREKDLAFETWKRGGVQTTIVSGLIEEIVFTGHSKGGALALLTGWATLQKQQAFISYLAKQGPENGIDEYWVSYAKKQQQERSIECIDSYFVSWAEAFVAKNKNFFEKSGSRSASSASSSTPHIMVHAFGPAPFIFKGIDVPEKWIIYQNPADFLTILTPVLRKINLYDGWLERNVKQIDWDLHKTRQIADTFLACSIPLIVTLADFASACFFEPTLPSRVMSQFSVSLAASLFSHTPFTKKWLQNLSLAALQPFLYYFFETYLWDSCTTIGCSSSVFIATLLSMATLSTFMRTPFLNLLRESFKAHSLWKGYLPAMCKDLSGDLNSFMEKTKLSRPDLTRSTSKKAGQRRPHKKKLRRASSGNWSVSHFKNALIETGMWAWQQLNGLRGYLFGQT